jgi:sugar O-acyltransferase (sialic acid O-acetyltransferase NeuD family)
VRKLIIAGASNPASIKLVNDINAKSPLWNLLGVVDDDPGKWGKDFFGFPVLGEIGLLGSPEYRDALAVCFIYGGSILTRVKIVERMEQMGVKFASLIHPSVTTDRVEIGDGCVVKEGCILNYGAKVGRHCILGFGTFIGHETVLEDLVYCAQRVTIPGRVRVKRCATLGVGSVLNGDITVGEYAMVGLGAVVFRDVPDRSTVIGNPARMIIRDSTEGRHPL